MFTTAKIQTFESNSQPVVYVVVAHLRCLRLQRYKLLKAIHNYLQRNSESQNDVYDCKDTNF